MDRNFVRALPAVLKHEGGYVNHPKDPGGPTNKGITLRNFRAFVKPNGTIEDLKALTTDQAGVVYRRQYWDAVSGNQLPSGVDYAVFDFGVNSGPKRAIQFLQRVVGVVDDGAIGPKTLKAIAAMPAAKIVVELCDNRLAWLQGLRTWKTFGKGWASRVAGVRKLALEFANVGSQPAAKAAPAPEAPVVPPLLETVVVAVPVGPPTAQPPPPSTGHGPLLLAIMAVLGAIFTGVLKFFGG